MMITLKCPECGESSSIAPDGFGMKVACRCGADLDPSSALDSPSSLETSTSLGTLSGLSAAAGSSAPSASGWSSAPRAPRKRRRPTPAEVPERVGRYEISHEIGRGAFGAVYLARDVNLDRQVALKVAHLDVVQNPDLVERFKKEARVAAKMKHEGIVIVHDVDAWESWLYIATEYIEGRNLRSILKEEGTLPPERAARIALALAQALAHAHLAGVTHRDVKPTNVMITPEGRVKLIDFGLVHHESSTQTREHAVLGTPNYMSPEQAAGDNARVKFASDQYSLGVVLYEMLCGKPPYKGEGLDVRALIASPDPVPGLREQNPEVPAELEAICLRALSKAVEGRYENCRAFAAALRGWLDAREGRGAGSPSEATAPAEAASPGSRSLAAPLDPRSREPLHALVRLAAERAGLEEREASARASRLAAIREDAERRRRLAKQEFDARRAALIEAESQRQRQAEALIESEITAAEAKYRERCESIRTQADACVADFQRKYDWALTVANGVFDVKRKRIEERWAGLTMAARRKHDRLLERVAALVQAYEIKWPSPPPDGRKPGDVTVSTGLRDVAARLDALESSRPRRLGRAAAAVLDLAVFLLVLGPAAITLLPHLSENPFAAAGVAAPAAFGVALYFDRVALRKLVAPPGDAVAAALVPICRELDLLDRRITRRAGGKDESLARWRAKALASYEEAVRRLEWERDQLVKQTTLLRSQKLEEAAKRLRERREELRAANPYDGASRGRLASLERRYRQERLAIDRAERAQEKAVETESLEAGRRIGERWRDGLLGVAASIEAIREAVDRLSPPWGAAAWSSWSPPRETPPVVRFGEVRVALSLVPHGLPADPLSHEGLPNELAWPALLPFPERANLLIEAPASARAQAVGALQAVAMRLLAGLPAGRARLAIIDPLGLGGDFGAFLQLADFEAILPPVLTDPEKIGQCLDDHLGHIKKVISALRNEYPTIREYNERAAEVAEPYRLLVVADYPAGFDDDARARLARIAAQGPRCGVLVLVAATADPGTGAGPGAAIADLARHAARLSHRGRGFVWDDPDFRPFPIALDPPPPAAPATSLLRRVGAAAEDARRVMVPFEFVTPPPEQWWAGSSAAGLEIPIGKAGPTKAQSLSLGRGTSQHVLIAGRTGSGKSTLFHALLVNLALKYSPDEVEFYLIDFKKGVEFKTYATHELPHARVIAVESEREFGLSVLRRLDDLLRDRGERFRQAGVHDLKGYREIEGLPPLPRVVLAVDEFQEFFVEDDALANDASQLLDRLVRQGRAFGIHVILGSQTLSGTYSLARSTLSQMGVRIALQCGEGDAHLILGEENDAARLLSRPGEAVYNDRNGLPEGNHFFQVVWLEESSREEYLRRVRALALERGWEPLAPQVVFEGNDVATIARNPLLAARLAAPGWPAGPQHVVAAWLGEPVAIKGPTAVQFRRRPGDNLLILGQDAEAATGVLAATLLGIAAQLPPEGPGAASFVLLDGVPEESPHAGALARAAARLPHRVEVGGRGRLAEVLGRLADEVERRLEPDAPADEAVFLLINNLSWFREIRRDDGFDFSAAARESARPAAALSKLLRSGPAVGVHVVAWCDTLNNLNRALERNDQREFGTRVAFQMSASDSSTLLDAPTAARLGPHRGLLAVEDAGTVEKFRPYGPPPPQWLARVQEQFARRLDPAEFEPEPEGDPGLGAGEGDGTGADPEFDPLPPGVGAAAGEGPATAAGAGAAVVERAPDGGGDGSLHEPCA